LARQEAATAYDKDVLIRQWASIHGGIYVPVTNETPPNPYLSNITERDITTPSGRKLTLMNPAYMTRQLHELQRKNQRIKGHLTSLIPIRPENRPDAWEEKALHVLEKGANEFVSLETIDGAEYLRLMRPLFTEQSCLTCHSVQGYKTGDFRGGISVAVPLQPILAADRAQRIRLLAGYSLIWLFGIGMIGVGYTRLSKQVLAREKAEQDLKTANLALEQIAIEDVLTGLANRRHFNAVLDSEVRRALRKKYCLTLMMIDVDFFKRYNDQYGHVVGDHCLQAIASVLRDGCKRAGQLAARYGGEEFAVIMPGSSPEEAASLAEKLRLAVTEKRLPHQDSEVATVVTVSIGVVTSIPSSSTTLEWFIKAADEALYRSKAGGRNRITAVS
jgi:diguanylate cyclase (GGDEF)-like protein